MLYNIVETIVLKRLLLLAHRVHANRQTRSLHVRT